MERWRYPTAAIKSGASGDSSPAKRKKRSRTVDHEGDPAKSPSNQAREARRLPERAGSSFFFFFSLVGFAAQRGPGLCPAPSAESRHGRSHADQISLHRLARGSFQAERMDSFKRVPELKKGRKVIERASLPATSEPA